MRVLMYVLFCHCHFNSERAGAETMEENNDEQNRTHRMKPKRDRDRSKERSEWKLSRRLIVDHFYAPKGAQRRTQTMLSSKAKKLSHYALFAFVASLSVELVVEVVEGGSGSSSSSSRCHWKLFVCRLPFTVAPSPLSSSFG